MPPESSVLKSARNMGAATFLSRILGLVREQVFAILFGASSAMDAYIVAFRIPNLLRDLFAEGAMSASLVPTFTRTREEEGEARAWRVAGLVFRVLFVTTAVIAVLGIIFSEQLVNLYCDAEFHLVPGKFELTVQMTRIMFPFFPMVAVAAAVMGVLNACGVFFIPAFSSALFNLGSIVVGASCALFLSSYGANWGFHPIEGMAFGVLAGGLFQLLSQIPVLFKKGYRWQKPAQGTWPVWYLDPRLRQMLWMMVPGTVGLAATQVNILVNTILATSQGPGAVSWLNYSFRLMQFPIGVFGVSMGAATLPVVSQLWVKKDYEGVRQTISKSLKQVFAINLPASAGLGFLGIPIIQLIFQYGRFNPEDTRSTAMALGMYAIGLTAYSMVKVLVPACYALGNTRLPVVSSVGAVVVTIVLNLLMIKPFGYWGLALGTSIAAICNAVFLLFSIRRLLGKEGMVFPFRGIFLSFLTHLGIALAMGSACWLLYRGIYDRLSDSWALLHLGRAALPFYRALKIGFLVIFGCLVVVGLGRAFRVTESQELSEIFLKKFKKKLSPPKT